MTDGPQHQPHIQVGQQPYPGQHPQQQHQQQHQGKRKWRRRVWDALDIDDCGCCAFDGCVIMAVAGVGATVAVRRARGR